MVNRVSAVGLQVRQYFHRYTEDALDLCDVFGSYTPGAKIKLDEICKIIGLPGKPSGMDGSEVESMVQTGRIAEVAEYCESDILNTYQLWLVYELFRGDITAEQLAFSETQAADFVRTRKSDNPHLAVSMGHASDTGNAAQSALRTVLEWFT
jgi:3'-5' exonuclease